MLRLPPNLNVELFEWQSADQRTEHPRHSDRGRPSPVLRRRRRRRRRSPTSARSRASESSAAARKSVPTAPCVAGNRWTYFVTPWGLLMELVDRSRVQNPPNLVGPADWNRRAKKEHPCLMIIAGHTLGTPGRPRRGARLFGAAGLDAAEVIYQDDYPPAISPSDRRSAQQAAAIADAEGVPIVGLTPYTTAINASTRASWQQGIDEFRGASRSRTSSGADRVRVYAGSWHPGDTDHAAHWDQLRSGADRPRARGRGRRASCSASRTTSAP